MFLLVPAYPGCPGSKAVKRSLLLLLLLWVLSYVDSFVYLGLCVNLTGGNHQDVHRRVELAHCCSKTLDHGIWKSCISLPTKVRLYSAYIIPVLMYGADVWSLISASQRRLDAFD